MLYYSVPFCTGKTKHHSATQSLWNMQDKLYCQLISLLTYMLGIASALEQQQPQQQQQELTPLSKHYDDGRSMYQIRSSSYAPPWLSTVYDLTPASTIHVVVCISKLLILQSVWCTLHIILLLYLYPYSVLQCTCSLFCHGSVGMHFNYKLKYIVHIPAASRVTL